MERNDDMWRAIENKFGILSLHNYQKTVLEFLLKKKNVFVCQRTGRGKSLCYQGYVTAKECQGDETSIVVVICPLISIMEEQVGYLKSVGISAAMLGRSKEDDQRAKEGKINYLYASPELMLARPDWRTTLKSPIFKRNLQLVVIDEAHLIIQWVIAKQQEEEAFRKWFSRVGELRSLVPSATILALTATASKHLREQIKRKLHITTSCQEVLDSPDRDNIKLFVKKVSASLNVTETFSWLLTSLKQQSLPRMLLFCKSIADCSTIYNMCRVEKSIDMCQVEMYHSMTPEEAKQHITNDMANENGSIKLLCCTNAAGMGINFKGVDIVMSYGPPQDMDTFVQHVGRAGRDGSQSSHLLLYHGRQLRNIDPDMLKYVKNTTTCRCEILLSAYNAKPNVIVHHLCCDMCDLDCDCELDACRLAVVHPAVQEEEEEDDDEELEAMHVTASDKETIQLLLDMYLGDKASTGPFSFLDDSNIFTEIVEDILQKIDKLQSADSVLQETIVSDYILAKDVFAIIAGVLNYNIPDYEESEDDDC